MHRTWDCIVVGGGAAGLSAALVLGRARRSTLVLDAGRQSNLPAEGIGGLLGHDGRPPGELYALGRRELEAYPTVQLREAEVADGTRDDHGLVLELADGTREHARRVLLATGMEYRFAELPGAAERWARSVFHCPFCHGWEVRDRPLAVLGRDEAAAARAVMLRAWSDEVTLLTDGPAELAAPVLDLLSAAGVAVDDRWVAGLRGPGADLEAILFDDGSERRCGGLLVGITLHQRSALAERLGAAVEARPPAADAVVVDAAFATTAPGVSAAGDAVAMMPSVANAIAAGSTAAARLVHGLLAEDAGRAAAGSAAA